MLEVHEEIKSVGIIAEYNPFHNGHAYQIQQVKKYFPNATIIVVMSGNFLQRGEPACVDKWTRTEQALTNEADLVLELPLGFAVQAADRFAFNGVRILQALQVEGLVFGAEHGNYDFMALAQQLTNLRGDFTNYAQSYAASYQQAVASQLGHEVTSPNDLLGLSYARANLALGSSLKLFPLQRLAADYHSQTLQADQAIASATAIREHLTKLPAIAAYVPPLTYQTLQAEKIVTWADFWPLLRSYLLTHPAEQLADVYGICEGIQHRMKQILEELPVDATYQDWLKKVKTKRFTYTRLARMTVALLLNIKQAEIAQLEAHPYTRVLGFNQKGQQHLKTHKKACPIDLITNVKQIDREGLLELDYRAGKLYQMFNGREQDVKHGPIRLQ